MSLRDTKNFLIEDLEDINKKIDKVNSKIKEIDLSIDKTNYFINELSGKASTDLALTFIHEKEREEKLKKEKDALKNYSAKKEELEEELDELLDRKHSLEKCSDSVYSLIEDNKKLASKEKNNFSNKKVISSIKDDLIEANSFISKSIEEFAFVDPNRIKTDLKMYEELMAKIFDKIDSIS